MQATTAAAIDRAQLDYEAAVAEERQATGSDRTQEYIASGIAAIVIGIYGYYNTAPNPLVKMLYAATQTAGVLTVGQALRNRNSPRLMVELDDLARQHGDDGKIDVRELKERVAQYRAKSIAADARTLAYTSSILSVLYFYNGFRETSQDHTLRNVYYFLGLNFAIGGGTGFYRMRHLDDQESVTLQLLPLPSLTYEF